MTKGCSEAVALVDDSDMRLALAVLFGDSMSISFTSCVERFLDLVRRRDYDKVFIGVDDADLDLICFSDDPGGLKDKFRQKTILLLGRDKCVEKMKCLTDDVGLVLPWPTDVGNDFIISVFNGMDIEPPADNDLADYSMDLSELRGEYQVLHEERLLGLQNLLMASEYDEDVLVEMGKLTHKINGAAGCYGYTMVSKAAEEWEHTVKGILARSTPVTPSEEILFRSFFDRVFILSQVNNAVL